MPNYDARGGFKHNNSHGTSNQADQGQFLATRGRQSGYTQRVLLIRPSPKHGSHCLPRWPRTNRCTKPDPSTPPLPGILPEKCKTPRRASLLWYFKTTPGHIGPATCIWQSDTAVNAPQNGWPEEEAPPETVPFQQALVIRRKGHSGPVARI